MRELENLTHEKLKKKHSKLYNHFVLYKGHTNLIAQEKMNELLEIEREMTIREESY